MSRGKTLSMETITNYLEKCEQMLLESDSEDINIIENEYYISGNFNDFAYDSDVDDKVIRFEVSNDSEDEYSDDESSDDYLDSDDNNSDTKNLYRKYKDTRRRK